MSTLFRILAGMALAVFLFACDQSPPTVMQYNKHGASFSYYSDWTIMDTPSSPEKAKFPTIEIDGPDNAVLVLVTLAEGTSLSLEDFARNLTKSRRKELRKDLSVGSIQTTEVSQQDSRPVTMQVAGKLNEGIEQPFSIELLGVKVPHHAKIFAVDGAGRRVFAMTQVPDEDAAKSEAGFKLVLDSISLAR